MAAKTTHTRRKRKALKTALFVCAAVLAGAAAVYYFYPSAYRSLPLPFAPRHEAGDILDSLDGVYVYYNGSVGRTHGRNVAPDGYNIGLKYQCVEFVKRYYYEHYRHKMPDSYGHAKDFFDKKLRDGTPNKRRGLIQYTNPSADKPRKGDLLVYCETTGNPYGHVAIVSAVTDGEIEVIQQNPGPNGKPRVAFRLEHTADGKWRIGSKRIMGWLRMK